MEPVAILAAVNAGLSLVETLLPRLSELVKTGQVTVEEQAEVLAKYEALKATAHANFTGPEWKIDA